MKIAKVVGTVVATQKVPSFEGVKLLLIQPLDEHLRPVGSPMVACDTVQAGVGDIVFYEGGREAALALPNWFNPSDCTILGIIDAVEVEGGMSS
ncbi:MAG: EutN/CcmL family microcompartment protein [Candidatus Caldatribacterium sp.]|uniref:EutN/CcmL family microcompartment protein n=1 Tax=Candidatus Caldatribacterium sp. TaxID=2282143 RepID=UPI002994D47F|nr:EutN/CcmL family microcompartment protein [Candidatus Caldatribacterium sp.]MCX7730101.1 EutN/CcmL family microcompartment protein [Candidatus Caldatribacterium sp.]MDW8080925.1 EutN/CcmL family microcompartment protein [Candidatus Calescibacterium sp.]